jgi:hypothetical protein
VERSSSPVELLVASVLGVPEDQMVLAGQETLAFLIAEEIVPCWSSHSMGEEASLSHLIASRAGLTAVAEARVRLACFESYAASWTASLGSLLGPDWHEVLMRCPIAPDSREQALAPGARPR